MTGTPPREVPLPDQAFNHHAPVWWGSTLFILIEGLGFALLVVTYFYLWRNFETWPPAGTPLPDLGVSTINVVVLVVGILPMWQVAQIVSRHDKPRLLSSWLLVCVVFGIAAAVLRVLEFKSVHTRFDANAYGAIAWSILAVHLAHIVAATLETLILAILMFKAPVEGKHSLDVTANATYWYFVALSWVGLYAIVFLAPRLI